jgi:hypothetical protein
MVGRGHTKETVGLFNVSSIHLNTLFDCMSWSYFNNPTVSLVWPPPTIEEGI